MKGGNYNSFPFRFLFFRLFSQLLCVILYVVFPLFQVFHSFGTFLYAVKDLKKLLWTNFTILGIFNQILLVAHSFSDKIHCSIGC